MKTQHVSSASLWSNANRQTSARHGIGDPADAIQKVVTVQQLIKSINSNPDAIDLLVARSHELSDAQRTAALKAFCPPKEAPRKAAPKARPPAPSRLSRRLAGLRLYGKSGTGARS